MYAYVYVCMYACMYAACGSSRTCAVNAMSFVSCNCITHACIAHIIRTHTSIHDDACSLREHLKDIRNQAMYCVVHGGISQELRALSVKYLTSLPFDGYAVGGRYSTCVCAYGVCVFVFFFLHSVCV